MSSRAALSSLALAIVAKKLRRASKALQRLWIRTISPRYPPIMIRSANFCRAFRSKRRTCNVIRFDAQRILRHRRDCCTRCQPHCRRVALCSQILELRTVELIQRRATREAIRCSRATQLLATLSSFSPSQLAIRRTRAPRHQLCKHRAPTWRAAASAVNRLNHPSMSLCRQPRHAAWMRVTTGESNAGSISRARSSSRASTRASAGCSRAEHVWADAATRVSSLTRARHPLAREIDPQ